MKVQIVTRGKVIYLSIYRNGVRTMKPIGILR